MSCRIGRHGQQKGDSFARWVREEYLSERLFMVHGKPHRTQPRNAKLRLAENMGKWTGEVLRKIRAEKGVGRRWANGAYCLE